LAEDGGNRHLVYSSAALRRSRQLLVEALTLLDTNPGSEGAAVLVRSSFEASILAVWLLGGPDRLDELLSDWSRHRRSILDSAKPHLGEDLVDAAKRLLPPAGRAKSIERMVWQAADWVADFEHPFAKSLYVTMTVDTDGTLAWHEAERPDGQPFRTAYDTFRVLSTDHVHGLGSLLHFLDGAAEVGYVRLERVAMMAMLLAKAIDYRNGYSGLEWLTTYTDERMAYLASRLALNAVSAAIVEDDPSLWLEWFAEQQS